MVINDCAKSLDKGEQVGTFVLDFEKAFDMGHEFSSHQKQVVWSLLI